MKEVGYNVKCTKGNVIKLHDVCRSVSTNEIVIVGEGVNKVHQMKGLVADNEVTGAGDWLSVYPDGELEVLCNLKYGASEIKRTFFMLIEGEDPIVVTVNDDVNRPDDIDCHCVLEAWKTNKYGYKKYDYWEIGACESHSI